ncbi:hypothetical protein DPMN_113499 [Dreissena polymorpha]|uniref:Uncharacterized protein n=1 Tax=Dreissena polymorpha TaxID=45954 RepID=A0A9D4KIS1_DREPO|nr:hypothetical protein DPMN_113499 [Dreissena polymorpha]
MNVAFRCLRPFIIGAYVLTKFHDDRPLSAPSKITKALRQHMMLKTNILGKFHYVWTKKYDFKGLTKKTAPPPIGKSVTDRQTQRAQTIRDKKQTALFFKGPELDSEMPLVERRVFLSESNSYVTLGPSPCGTPVPISHISHLTPPTYIQWSAIVIYCFNLEANDLSCFQSCAF